ncbi:hypothetical protein M378DRAFT_167162, partial [Amanita muscaria Koide BX008]
SISLSSKLQKNPNVQAHRQTRSTQNLATIQALEVLELLWPKVETEEVHSTV